MGAQKIILPADSTGKAIYTQERTVTGPGTVQLQYVITASERVLSGVYSAQTGLHSVSATATNGTTTGNWWLYNPVGSTTLISVRRIEFASGSGAASVAIATSPRIQLSRFTFTGTPAGTTITSGKIDSNFPTATAVLKSTQVTSVVTLAGDIFAFLTGIWCQSTSSGGPGAGQTSDWLPDEDGQPVLRAGEGIACWQPDAGSTSDPRRFVTNIAWTEYTVP
jgi:hypothetical protein